MSEKAPLPGKNNKEIDAANGALKVEVDSTGELTRSSAKFKKIARKAFKSAQHEGAKILSNKGHDAIDGVSVTDHLQHIGHPEDANFIDQAKKNYVAAALRHDGNVKAEEAALSKARAHKENNLADYIDLAHDTAIDDGYAVNTQEIIDARQDKEDNLESYITEARQMAAANGTEIVTAEMIRVARIQKAMEDLEQFELPEGEILQAMDYISSLVGIDFKPNDGAENSDEINKILEKFEEVGLVPFESKDAEDNAVLYFSERFTDFGQVMNEVRANLRSLRVRGKVYNRAAQNEEWAHELLGKSVS